MIDCAIDGFADHRSGAFLITQGGKIIVPDVRPGTPAATAGIMRGDVLATVNGRDAGALGLAAVRDLLGGTPGTAVSLHVVARDETARDVNLTLRDYV
jgi:C-terminal processing protease CtpA/Prc